MATIRFDCGGEVTGDLLYPGDAPTEDNCQISRWEHGTPNYEALAGLVATVDYLASLHDPSACDGGAGRREAVVRSYTDIQKHEAAISHTFLTGLKPFIAQDKVG